MLAYCLFCKIIRKSPINMTHEEYPQNVFLLPPKQTSNWENTEINFAQSHFTRSYWFNRVTSIEHLLQIPRTTLSALPFIIVKPS